MYYKIQIAGKAEMVDFDGQKPAIGTFIHRPIKMLVVFAGDV